MTTLRPFLTRLTVAAAAVAAITAATGGAHPSAAADATLLRFHTFTPPVSASFKANAAWAKMVENDSNGTLKIQMFPSNQLGGKAADLYNQAKNGVVDIVWTLPGYTPGVFPRADAFELPFTGAARAPAASAAAQEFHDKWLKEEFGAVHGLVFHAPAPAAFHIKTRPIHKLADFKGLKIRGPSRPINDMLEIFGASAVGIPGVDATQAVVRGVIDGAIYPFSISASTGMIDATRYHTEAVAFQSILMVVMNKAAFEKLPADAKKALDKHDGLPEAIRRGNIWQEDEEKIGIAKAKKLNHEVYILPEEERERWTKASQPVVDSWIKDMTAKGHPAAEMVSDIRGWVAKYRKEFEKN